MPTTTGTWHPAGPCTPPQPPPLPLTGSDFLLICLHSILFVRVFVGLRREGQPIGPCGAQGGGWDNLLEMGGVGVMGGAGVPHHSQSS